MKKTVLVLLAAMMVLGGLSTVFAKNDKDKGGDKDKDKKCNWSTRWEKNPETFRLAPDQEQTFTLIVTNHEKDKSVTLEFGTDSEYVKFDPTSVELAAKSSANIKVTVKMPPNPKNVEKATFKYWIKPSDTDKKEYKFDVHYAKTDKKPEEKPCIFHAKWESESTYTPLEPGQTKTQVLLVTNPSKTEDIKISVVTESKNIEFSETSFTVKPGETYKLTVTVTQPEKGDEWKTVWSFFLKAECGMKKQFWIKAPYPGFCAFDVKWEKAPPATLEPGKEVKLVLIIKNLNPKEPFDATIVSDNPNMTFSETSFTVPAGGTYKITVTIKQPEKGDANYTTWKFEINSSCGAKKEIAFKIKYPTQPKPECKFEASFPPGQENKKMQRGKKGQVIIHVRNTGDKTLEFKIGTNQPFAKADPSKFKLDAGKLIVVKINITVPKDYEKDYLELVVRVKTSCGSKDLKMKLAVTK
jgi:uncharacterized membrane protein